MVQNNAGSTFKRWKKKKQPGREKWSQCHLHKHPNIADVITPECGPRLVLLQHLPAREEEGKGKGRARHWREREPAASLSADARPRRFSEERKEIPGPCSLCDPVGDTCLRDVSGLVIHSY